MFSSNTNIRLKKGTARIRSVCFSKRKAEQESHTIWKLLRKNMNHIYTYTHNEEIRIAKIWSKNTNGLSITNTIHYTPQLTALALFYSAIINAIYRLTESMLCLTTVAGTERFSLVVALTQHYVCFFYRLLLI